MPYDQDTLELLLAEYDLPDLPYATYDDDPEARLLWIFRQDDGKLALGWPVSYDDARAYCSREDTHGDGWFVGFDRP